MSAGYQIRDEPVGRTSGFAVEPFWGLLGLMIGGTWLGAIAYAMNAWSLRGPTWQRELALCAALPIGAASLFVLIGWLAGNGILPESLVKYALLALVVWKMTLGYVLFFLQQTSYGLYEYFGGKGRQGAIVVVIGYFLGRGVLRQIENPVLHAALS
jgi:hypothetical protein